MAVSKWHTATANTVRLVPQSLQWLPVMLVGPRRGASGTLLLLILCAAAISSADPDGGRGRSGAARGMMQRDQSYRSNIIDGGEFISNSNLMITVPAGQPTSISSHHLSYTSPALDPQEVVYRIAKPLAVHEGRLVLTDRPQMPAQQFSQADINAMRLVYIPPDADTLSKEEVYSVRLALTKARTNMELDEQKTFRIRVQLPNQLEPKFKIKNPKIQLNQVTTVDIPKRYFEIERTDNDDPNLTFVVTEMPSSGSLTFVFDNNSLINLDGGNEFYLENFDNGLVKYRYHGDRNQLQDSFEVLATDGNFEVANLFSLDVIPKYTTSEFKTKAAMIQFENQREIVTVNENVPSVRVGVVREGNTSVESQVWCHTLDRTAHARKDFIERPITVNRSLLIFEPGISKLDCEVLIVDDRVYEGEEEFGLKLETVPGSSAATLGERSLVRVKIVDLEDKPRIQFDRGQVTVSDPGSRKVADVTTSVTVNVVRKGDTSQESRVRAASCDGTALKGVDYEELSQLLVFSRGIEMLPLRVRVIYRHNSRKLLHRTLTFAVALMQEGLIGADLGDLSSVTIAMNQQSRSGEAVMKVLPSRPIIVSLLNYDRIVEIVDSELSPGYPLVCISSCDERYPFFNATQKLCQQADIKDIAYSWEIAVPSSSMTSSIISQTHLPFREIIDSTIYSDVHSKVLDPSFFTTKFKVRCTTTPLSRINHNKILGVSTRSKMVNIGSEHMAICPHSGTSRTPGFEYREHSFLASLKYVDGSSEDTRHRNEIHVHIEIPHTDGMLPLVSTLPLSNPRVLLIDSRQTSQHMCSNLHNSSAFLAEAVSARDIPIGAGFSRPHQLSASLRGNRTVQLYQHLNLNTCLWTFDAWFHMSQLVDNCGGKVTSEFQIGDNGESYVTVRVPLFVTYVTARAPLGWTAVDHRTEMEVSFYYTSLLWHHGNLNTQSQYDATIQVTRISVDEDGRLQLDFNTVAHFRGHFVSSHHTLPDVRSEVHPPAGMGTNLTLDLVWSQSTWDGPQQAWRATSIYSLQDYSGVYSVVLVPCSVGAGQPYYNTTGRIRRQTNCMAHAPAQFKLPITFQQSSRPAPLLYSLDTQFTITNNRAVFLARPSEPDSMLDYPGVFLPGEAVYGRVMWHPSQHLHAAYTLTIQRLYLCAGADGYVPAFDPTGQLHHAGPQYGCLQTSPKVKHTFLLLDRDNPHSVDKVFDDIKFEAYFANQLPDLEQLESYPGVDGFIVKVDPLYKINSGYQWYLQVLYTIGPTISSRTKRSAKMEETTSVIRPLSNTSRQNGTNVKSLRLHDTTVVDSPTSQSRTMDLSKSTVIGVFVVALIGTTAGAVFWWLRGQWSTNCMEGRRQNTAPLNTSVTTVATNAKTVRVRAVPVTIWNNFSPHEGTEV